MPPISREFPRLVREILAPLLAERGFSRPRGVGFDGWVRDEGGAWTVAWVLPRLSNRGDTPQVCLFTVRGS